MHKFIYCSTVRNYKILGQPKCLLIREWLDQLYFPAMGYYAVVKKNEKELYELM